MNHQGLGQHAIAREVRTSDTLVRNVIRSYDETNSSIRIPGANLSKTDPNFLEYIEVQKVTTPSTYASEIQHRLLLDGVVTSQNREDLLFGKKKLTVSLLEAEKPGALDGRNEYIQAVSRYPASKLHFYDESSVIKATGNRKNGNTRVSERAIEVQRYASNAAFTINLLHLVVGFNYFNILQGPSNGLELSNFFDRALQVD